MFLRPEVLGISITTLQCMWMRWCKIKNLSFCHTDFSTIFFLHSLVHVSLPYLRGHRLCLSNDLVGHLEDGSWIGFPVDANKMKSRLSGTSRSRKTNRQRFFFLVGAKKNAPKSGEIEPVLEDRSGTDFLPETGCFFRYRYFDGTLGVGCLCPMFFRWQAQLVWCIGSVHWKHLVFPTFSQ